MIHRLKAVHIIDRWCADERWSQEQLVGHLADTKYHGQEAHSGRFALRFCELPDQRGLVWAFQGIPDFVELLFTCLFEDDILCMS